MNIVVLAGGISTERDVSLVSGKMIYQALKSTNNVILLDVYFGFEGDADKTIFTAPRDWASSINPISSENPDINEIKAARKDNSSGFFGPNVIKVCQMADIVFMALHGESGENGKVQAAFDLLGIKYTGTDYVSSALAMDKALTKELLLQHNIPTPKSIVIHSMEEWKGQIPYPCVVKTSCGGSSVGVYIAKDSEETESAIAGALLYGDEVLIEQYIKGREFSIGVVDNHALPIIEIAPLEGFYDYKNKYQAGSTVETCPAELPLEITETMQKAAEEVFRALRLKVYARIDFMMDEHFHFYCLEANTLPGFTPTSLLPQEASAIGRSYSNLCQWVIDLSLKKYE